MIIRNYASASIEMFTSADNHRSQTIGHGLQGFQQSTGHLIEPQT